MNKKEADLVNELEKLEPVFVKAGEHALARQKDIKHTTKHNSGTFEVDVVTEADGETQEIILKAMAETPLVDCNLIAEEDAPTVSKFKTTGNLFLTLDPIDGTALYVSGKKFWSVIVGLHNEKEMLYSFAHFPAVNWTNKIIGNKYESIGKLPKIAIKTPPLKTIVHSYGSPDVIDRDIYNKLIENGYSFRDRHDFSDESGGSALFFTNDFAGYFIPNPNAYDGLVMYHYAKATGCEILSSGPDGEFRIDRFEDDHGPRHPGYYIVLRNNILEEDQ